MMNNVKWGRRLKSTNIYLYSPEVESQIHIIQWFDLLNKYYFFKKSIHIWFNHCTESSAKGICIWIANHGITTNNSLQKIYRKHPKSWGRVSAIDFVIKITAFSTASLHITSTQDMMSDKVSNITAQKREIWQTVIMQSLWWETGEYRSSRRDGNLR